MRYVYVVLHDSSLSSLMYQPVLNLSVTGFAIEQSETHDCSLESDGSKGSSDLN